jgi:FkbM family methyltransferase
MKTYFEIGANQGQDTEKFLEDPEIRLYAFEPVPALAKDLFDRFGKNPNFFLLPFAVDNVNTFSKLNISEIADWGVSSFYDFSPDLAEKNWNWHQFQYTNFVHNMFCIRLEDFINLAGITEIDYIHIDAQGSDFKVLQSLGDKISIVKSGVCEVAQKAELYKDTGNTIDVVKPWLESKGFKVRAEDDGVGKPFATVTGNEANLFFSR